MINLRTYYLKYTLFTFFLLGLALSIDAQDVNGIKVLDEENELLYYPWAGGLNSVQFGEIDLNRDGLKDLFAFDRHGNRELCFINDGIYNTVSYSLRPEYVDLLPELFEWAIFVDYNGDDKVDIFTYSPNWAGMKVYKNVSDNILKFELIVSPYLKSLYGEMYLNLLVTEVDYPGISDVDNDGDLDILTFWGLGSFVNYHKNMSMEKYGHADSLDYELKEYCWGLFAESEESNTIYLDTCFDQQPFLPGNIEKERHTGSTFLLLDLDQDTIKDLLLGDIDFPGLFVLKNDGSRYHAHIGSYDTLFPVNTEKIELFSFPVAAYIDVNNDLKKDLLVSPFDPQLTKAENKNSVWYYKNTGSNDKPFFSLITKDFIQSGMIDVGSGSSPVLFDWDKDGLLDLFVGNYGFYQYSYYENYTLNSVYQSRVAYYRNTGSQQNPQFQLFDGDFAGLSALNYTGINPTFDDLDGDGDFDMLAGYDNGKIILAKNLGNDSFELITENYLDIDIGFYSTPQLFDLDKDGLKDLIIGEENGNLNYYRNNGSLSNPVFDFITDSLGKVNVTNYNLSYTGYSNPRFFRDENEVTQLLVGSEDGLIFYFTDIDGNLDGKFTQSDGLGDLLDTTNISFDRGMRTAADIAEITKDGKLEMITGNYSGGLEYFNGNADVSPGFEEGIVAKQTHLNIFPNPANEKINFQISKNTTSLSSVYIYNTDGKLIIQNDKLKKQGLFYTISTSGLKNGIYLLKVIDKQEIYTGSFVIQTN